MILRETANQFLEYVYREGLASAKKHLSGKVQEGCRESRKLLNSIGLLEQSSQACRISDFRDSPCETCSPPEVAMCLRSVLESRELSLLTDRLVSEILENSLPISDAIGTLRNR